MTKDGLFKIIRFFGYAFMIWSASGARATASTAEERREMWLLNKEAGKSARNLSQKQQQDLLAGCADSLESYCNELRKGLGLGQPTWVAEGQKMKWSAADVEDEPVVRQKKGKSRLRKNFERRKLLAKAKAPKKRSPVAQRDKRRRSPGPGRGNG